MKNRWKRLAVVLGAATLVVCQDGVIQVKAEEATATEESVLKEETGDNEDVSQKTEDGEEEAMTEEKEDSMEEGAENAEKDASNEEGAKNEEPETEDEKVEDAETDDKEDVSQKAEDDASKAEQDENSAKKETGNKEEEPENLKTEQLEAENVEKKDVNLDKTAERTAQVLAVENLRWENGKAVFYNPNTVKVSFEIHIFKDGKYAGGQTTTNTNGKADAPGDVIVDLNYCFSKYGDGSYTYKVVTFADGVKPDHKLDGAGALSGESSVYPDQDNSGQDDRTLLPATNLRWNERWQGIFYNPNEYASLVAHVYGPGGEEVAQFYDGGVHTKGEVAYDLYHIIEQWGENGAYTFAVEAVYWNGDVRIMSEASSKSGSYTKPDERLPEPKLTISKSGIVSCELSGADEYVLGTDYGFECEVYEGGEQIGSTRGVNETQIDISSDVKKGHKYTIKVRTLSRKIDIILSSKQVECTLDLSVMEESPAKADSGSSDANLYEEEYVASEIGSAAAAVVEEWKPTTPDEIKRYAAYSREKVNYAADAKNAYGVTILNAMQGKMCFDSFEAVLNDWIIGRTYNILPSGRLAYKMDSKARIALSIPKTLQAAGREFKMICVTEKGQPVILDDLDSSPETITFETDMYYAFALIYKDAVASK